MYYDEVTNKIILLLSNHRNADTSEIPTTLTKSQLVSLLRCNLPPNRSPENLNSDIYEILRELQAQGEISVGKGNRYCIAPPTVLAQDKSNLTGLLFRGDRAYLSVAHQVLETKQEREKIHLRPQIHGFNRIKDRLTQVGIRLLTVSNSIEHLPLPHQPSKAILRSPWSQNPFENTDRPNNSIRCYDLKQNTTQKDRWTNIHRQSELLDRTLLQLSTGEYLWFVDSAFYELEQDTAVLTMFAQDKEKNCLLRIVWDKTEGKINLQDIYLPSSYARWLWQLSEDGDRYRIRYVKPLNQPLVESAFQRLGCSLV